MKVDLITPVRPGGPYNTGKYLARVLNEKGISAYWAHRPLRVLSSPIWTNADIVHSLSIPLSYRFWGKPLVLTVLGEYPIEKTLWQNFYPRAIRKADIVTTHSYFLKERLNLPDAIVIPHAIFPEEFTPVAHVEKVPINLATVTSFYFEDKARGILDILATISKLPEKIKKQIKYSVIGGGPFLEKIIDESKRYQVHVEFRGIVQNVKQSLQNSDIFLYYSSHDNTPTVILEAMACGLPVITNNVGAVSEMIEDGKDGFIAANYDSYSEILLKLIGSYKFREMIGAAARSTVESKYSYEIIGDKYIELYQNIIGVH